MSRQTTAHIDLCALQNNLNIIKKLAPDSRVMSVVKADAYGHGIERVVPALSQTDAFAVATLGEAARVRDTGWNGPLVLLEGFRNNEELTVGCELETEMVIHHESQLNWLEASGTRLAKRLWLKIDSGMHRLGFPAAEAESVYSVLEQYSGPEGIGLMSHLACADDIDNHMTTMQIERFATATRHLDGQRSLANSAAILNFESAKLDWIRPGLVLYGISPLAGTQGTDYGLQPAMTLECRIIAVNHCKKGDSVGYGAAYMCPEDMPIGVAAIGYGDGYPWRAPNGTPMLVGEQPAVMAGRVSMDMITIDLRGNPEANVGDLVTLWGTGMPIEQVADSCGTIPWELICSVTSRVSFDSKKP